MRADRRSVGDRARCARIRRPGRATSTITTVAYLGFLAGPAYVGAWADGVGLSGAMLAVAALAALLATLAAAGLRTHDDPRLRIASI